MAKVVLVWNEHPLETVAGHHARKCADILRTLGHEVVLEKTPVAKTTYGIIRDQTPRQAAKTLAEKDGKGCFDLGGSLRKYSKKHDAPVFSFHSSSPEILGYSEKNEPKKFKTGPMGSPGLWYPHEITFVNGNYYVEVPAIDHELPKQMRNKMKTKITKVKNIVKESSVENLLDPYHNVTYSKIRQPEQQKYLDPLITKKIADAIHEIITNKNIGK
ncbi:MAG: hypothetical protein WC408_02995 [Candidatus Micrarchaeia archaeon]|jgi:hypothetical protein